MTTQAGVMPKQGEQPPNAKAGWPWLGPAWPFARNRMEFLQRLAESWGEIVSFTLFGQRLVLLTGAEASELFYLSPEEQIDQSAPYRNIMTPIFGEGVLFDASIERKNEQLRVITPALRMEALRQHVHTISDEVKAMTGRWGDLGEIDLLESMQQLTMRTASRCLLGETFQQTFGHEFARIYHDLDRALTPLAYVLPRLPIARFRRRDHARRCLQDMITQVIQSRTLQQQKPSDMLQFLIETRYSDGSKLTNTEITGLLIATFMGGHHTTAGTAAWGLIELLRHPEILDKARKELDLLFGARDEATFELLKESSYLDNVFKETLRLHPPLPLIMRKTLQDLRFKQYTIKAGSLLLASPTVTHRLSRAFPHPQAFDPDRYNPLRREDRTLAYQPFGGGRHKCRGVVFATLHLKAIFAILLRQYEFELVDAPESYVDDYTDAIAQPRKPCRVRYRRRPALGFASAVSKRATRYALETGCPFHRQ